ncbi:rhodanese-like domain-containing protein [Algoriphagus sp. CAU 1675]|uniref:rhodanese-like domain-containing protein n=1 Tax=Algoriphagus sp. CAU 1675 TaxID=3032597 RepID=UPI0023D9EA6D|nr:rhodanese-like domain-containing protein [Algoriphagus sp. CAU 1675]MDF2158215.1 rhodanese-like domain-containing protein [Algoriphagus sp. CAU 1675]
MFNFFQSKPKNYEDIPVGEFHELMLQPDTVILDVRTPGEFASGKIRGARNIDIMSRDFVNQVKNLPKDKTYLIYCRSGNRSGQACEIMADLGFEKLKNMAGGIMRWPFETV